MLVSLYLLIVRDVFKLVNMLYDDNQNKSWYLMSNTVIYWVTFT